MTHVSIPFSLRRYEDGAVTEVHKEVTVGRLASNDIVLHGPKSSRSHAILQVEEGRLIIGDRGSTNGTYVNGVRIVGKEIVRAGDTVRFDREVFLVQGPAADWDKTEPRHPATWVLWPDVPRRGQDGVTVFIKEPASPGSAGPIAQNVQCPTVQILSGALAGMLYELRLNDAQEQQWIVGQDAESDIRLPDQGVSRRHATIERCNSLWRIRDKFSTNKLLVDGQYSTIRVLDGGEFIGIGPVQAVFLLPARRMPGMPALLHGLHGARFWGVVAVLSAMACCAALLFFLT